MESQHIVYVGIGAPVDDELIFNFHFSQNKISWVIELSYSQLKRIDTFITSNSDKINHVIFPYLKSYDIKTIIEFITMDNNLECENHPVSKMLLKTTKIIENWIHMILLRLHVMSNNIVQDILKLTKLPDGPFSDNELKSFGLPENPRPSNIKSINKAKDIMAKVVEYEKQIEISNPPLLKISVSRTSVVQKGKSQYKVLEQIIHSRSYYHEYFTRIIFV